MLEDLTKLAKVDNALRDKEIAHLVINENKVLSQNIIDGMQVDVKEKEKGVNISMLVYETIEKPVHLCFGIMREKKLQEINMNIEIKDGVKVGFISHCILPRKNTRHVMNSLIHIGERAEYSYTEKHIHGLEGGIEVYPKTSVKMERKAKFKTDFELIKGRIGLLDIDYEIEVGEEAIMEMVTKASGYKDDIIKIKEIGYLYGRRARGVLKSRIAARDNAKAEVYNKMVAMGAYARGHVDCKEIIKDNGTAIAIPVVEVRHPKAHVTHEAAIGSVDEKQLETLMARGLSEEEAAELIIEGLLA